MHETSSATISGDARSSGDPQWQKLTAVTPITPFAAILAGRNRFAFTPMD